MSALVAFFGSVGFRFILGEIMGIVKARQERKAEIELMEKQRQMDADKAAQQLEAIKLQADKGVEVIRVQGTDTRDTIGAEAFAKLTDTIRRRSGNKYIDAWNAAINPALATWAVVMVSAHYFGAVTLGEEGWALCGGAIGLYLADRNLFKRGK